MPIVIMMMILMMKLLTMVIVDADLSAKISLLFQLKSVMMMISMRIISLIKIMGFPKGATQFTNPIIRY